MDKLPHYCPICAFLEWNLDGLVEMCWDYLDMVRRWWEEGGEREGLPQPADAHHTRGAAPPHRALAAGARVHQAQGQAARLQRACGDAQAAVHGRGLLQQDPQDAHQAVQVSGA